MGVRKSSVVSKPITSKAALDELKAERKERNRLNRQRAKAMERRVAKYLGGDRTPQSGAGSTKGDVTVLFSNRPGRYVIECKLTELFDRHGPSISISKAWLSKIHLEAQQMSAVFGMLVYRYHARQDDYVLIRSIDLQKVVKNVVETPHVLDFSKSKAKTFAMPLERSLLCKEPPGVVCVLVDYVVYYLMTLERFKEMIEDV
jgi:hypothetical protein